jgi:hypothetical protein
MRRKVLVPVAVAALALTLVAGRALWGSSADARAAAREAAREAEDRARHLAERNAAEGRPIVTLARASDIGLDGWQPTVRDPDPTSDHGELKLRGSESAAMALAERSDGLEFLRTDRGPGLVGVIEPHDQDAIVTAMLLTPVKVRQLADAPPTPQLHSLADAAAAVAVLIAVESSAAALVGENASQYPDECRALEAAAGAWPESARLSRVVAVPPDSDLPKNSLSVNCGPDDRSQAFMDRLREAGSISFESWKGVWPRALATINYQNAAGGDRWLAITFALDKATGQWVLIKVDSQPALADAIRWRRNDNMEEYHRNVHTLDLTAVLRDHVVTHQGLVPLK